MGARLATNSHSRAVTSMEWAPMKSAARLILSRSKMENARRFISPNETESAMLSSRNRSRICPMCWTFLPPLHAVGEEALLQADLGGREHLAHLVDQRIDQVVVGPLVALQQKAQQIEACHVLRKLLQLLHGVVIDQRRVICDAVVGNSKLGQQRHRGSVQSLQHPPPTLLPPLLPPPQT